MAAFVYDGVDLLTEEEYLAQQGSPSQEPIPQPSQSEQPATEE